MNRDMSEKFSGHVAAFTEILGGIRIDVTVLLPDQTLDEKQS